MKKPDEIEILRMADDGCPHHFEPNNRAALLAAAGEFGGIAAPETESQADIDYALRQKFPFSYPIQVQWLSYSVGLMTPWVS